MHHKASSTESDQFRRAVEAYRIVQDINSYVAANPGHDEFLLLGDLNEDISRASFQRAQFVLADYQTFSRSASWPAGYRLGADLEALLTQSSLSYLAFPDDRYAGAGGGMHRLDLFQQNGTTRITRPSGGSILDYIFVSTALRDSPLGAPRGEVYNSQLDTEIYPGLRKVGGPLPAATSTNASDHLAVFANIEMEDAEPAASITAFSPAAGAPGATVTITGLLLGGVESVRFGGVEAAFTVEGETRIIATVPAGAATGPITVSGPGGQAWSAQSFLVAVLPTAEFAVATPSLLEGFVAMSGAPSLAQSFAVSAAGLRGPLVVTAPAGFEVSSDGVNFRRSVEVEGAPRGDRAGNYGAQWTAGSNEGNGFAPWYFSTDAGTGQAQAYLADPSLSGVQEMGPQAFTLRAGPEGAAASVWINRALQRPLALGETFSFDWGVNWDSNNGSKGFAVASGSAAVLYVIQYGYPGQIYLLHDGGSVDTGLGFGQRPMRWSFRQIDTTTLNVTATSRTGGTGVAYSTNIVVPGAANSFWWYADSMDPDVRRYSYYDNLSIQPAGPGGGAVEGATLHVRLAADAPVGLVGGDLQLASNGQGLGTLALNGAVSAAGAVYDAWAGSHGLDPSGDGAPGQDKDGDGHSNWLEFAFGTSPVAPDGALVEARASNNAVTFEFLRRKFEVTYQILHTTTLAAAFFAATGLEVVPSSNQDGVPDGWELATFTVPAQGAGFYRIGASPK
jgi:hypothetical protein